MKAVRVNAWGQPVEVEEVPQPAAGQDEVLVKVHAASLNPFDTFVHSGYMQAYLTLPLTLGTDFAGEVSAVGPGVSHVKPGDAVYGLVPMHSGSFAEYVVAKTHEVAHKPKTLSFVEAAGVPLASLAGYQSLIDLGQFQKGQRVLIIGAGGPVGACALQVAKDLGAYVYAVDVPEKGAFVRSLGADRFIDAKNERYEEVASGVDLALDFVSGDNFARAVSALKPGGRYVTSLFLPEDQSAAQAKGVTAQSLGTQPRVDQLDELARRIDGGKLKIFINRTFPLHQAQEAITYRLSSPQPGKVILTL